ncbi:MAG: hypothetical protein J6T99_00970 [Oscillospiraceae bacterium]|nr:hypothetical protein [Oscillospiraceae bacterium]
MQEKYFLHRIQEKNGSFTKGIEIHDTLDAAVLSFWGRMKLAYGGDPDITFMSCKITDINGGVIAPYNQTWQGNAGAANKFFMHHIRLDGETFSKDIDICDTFDAARTAFAACMEYGYNNTKHPNVNYVSCEITDRSGSVLLPFDETWIKAEPEQEVE